MVPDTLKGVFGDKLVISVYINYSGADEEFMIFTYSIFNENIIHE